MPETTPLLSGANTGNYYFLNSNGTEGTTPLVRDEDGGVIVEDVPPGANAAEFEPRKLGPMRQVVTSAADEDKKSGFFSKLLAKKPLTKAPSMLKQRSAPIKIEPKVFFANERTFLAWMHISIILAGASIAILSFSGASENAGSQIYGIVMLPVAILFMVYSMYQYVRRAYMIRNRHPGPYDDTVGPMVLGIMLMLSIVAQFAVKLYAMSM